MALPRLAPESGTAASTSRRETVLRDDEAAALPFLSAWLTEAGKVRFTKTFSGRCLKAWGFGPPPSLTSAGRSPTTGTNAWAPSFQTPV